MGDTDVRSTAGLEHEDIAALNFVRRRCRFVFRRHFRQGLRSHVMEVLTEEGLQAERRGVVSGGLLRYPEARPRKMLRIFRRRFSGAAQALDEIRRLRIVETYLPADLIARSEEFLVSYRHGGRHHLLLCGLQEYVSGEILDPWSLPLPDSRPPDRTLGRSASRFVAGVKQMVVEKGYVPDLAGIGNLFVTPEDLIKLVDINNISKIPGDDRICLDDRGYPACDKSLEALARIERHLCGAGPQIVGRPPYDRFLSAARMQRVRELEERFLQGLKGPGTDKTP